MRTNCLISLLITILSQVSLITSENCPKPEILSKYTCFCYPNGDVICGGDKNINFKHMFEELSQLSSDGNRHFKSFELYNTAITELEEHFFSDITFDKISITGTNLTSINTNAFNGTNLITTSFRLSKTPYKNPDIFHTLSKMKNLREIVLEDTALEEIPSFAFKPMVGYLNNLTVMQINGQKPKKISSNAFFSLSSLKTLYFAYSSLDSIQSNAFHFSKESNETLIITLDNNVFEGSVLEPNSLQNIRRPVTLVHNCKLYPCHLKYLDEKIFAPFFNQNLLNKIIPHGGDYIHVDCNDCRSYWLKKSAKYLQRTEYLKCIDEKPFLDSTNFKSCS